MYYIKVVCSMGYFYFPYLLELIVFIGSGGVFTALTIRNQYVYNVIAQMHNYTSNNSLDYCAADDNTSSVEDDIVAAEASRWQIYINVACGVPSVFAAIILTSWSDKVGRKIPLALTLFGFTISHTLQLVVILLSWPLYMLVVSSLLYGIFGGFVGMLNICMAAISDITTKEQRVARYTLLECSMGLGGGLISFVCGFWITADGFIPSSYLSASVSLISFLLVGFLPSKTLKVEQQQQINGGAVNKIKTNINDNMSKAQIHQSSSFARFKLIKQVYTSEHSICNICDSEFRKDQINLCSHGGGLRKGRVWRMWFYLLAFNLYLFPVFGTGIFDTMYYLSYPLCFSPTLIGIRMALSFGSVALAPGLVLFYKRVLRLSNVTIILQGIVALIGIDLMISFAKQQYVVFIASSFTIFMQVTAPVLRTQISSLASISEQGAALSLISGTENFSNMFSNVAYLLLYPATLPIYHGFMWCLSCAILLIPLTMITIVWIADRKKLKASFSATEEDHSPLIDVD
ncbi:proton-coupled folate transporter-like isoform X1 [Styela clava]